MSLAKFTQEQASIYKVIVAAVEQEHGGVFFVNGFGGSGKTFIWNTLTCTLRSRGDVVLAVASSGIASQLIPGGRTAHSRFVIPLDCNETSTCNIIQGSSNLANLLLHTKLIIWDEAPMAHRYCFEALDKTLRDICGKDNIDRQNKHFGGKVIVFGGDFRQTLPVIPRGSRQDIVHSSLNSSYIWDSCNVLTLTKNMRLGTGRNEAENLDIAEFAEWILKIGNGEIRDVVNDEEKDITIPDDILIKNVDDPFQPIVDSTYPSFTDQFANHEYIRHRAILAPTLDNVASVNEYMLSLLPGEERTYLSSDNILNQESNSHLGAIYTTEFLNTITGSGLPYHQLKLKVGEPIMLLHNNDKSLGLCNGTRLVVARLCKHVIEATIISGKFAGERVIIARMVLSPSDSRLPFKFQRRQFPIVM
ncbi:ATP-dependent DNA helicase PIF1-like [Senna tora]|uniref:ATP-dependent DNA helicase n=1 Tax=Senna tora TaxID=362788 RepID=A0A834WZP3_9FABA|nr:ATP-dependent DNA helicase PIF1-like [Senna tora]